MHTIYILYIKRPHPSANEVYQFVDVHQYTFNPQYLFIDNK